MTGTMNKTWKLLGVHGMQLEEGQRVNLLPSTNLPSPQNQGYFASPEDGKWSDGVERSPEDSIHVDPEDVTVDN